MIETGVHNQISLEAGCRRNVELMWLLGRLYPDHKSIAELRRMHRDAVVAAGAEIERCLRLFPLKCRQHPI